MKRRILIASPVKDAFPAHYVKAIVELLMNPPPGCGLGLMHSRSGGIHFARDQMADYALKHNYDETIFWDIDLIPSLAMFHRLCSHDTADIVCGFYAKKDPLTHFNVQQITSATPDPTTGLIEVSRCAIGFSKINSRVFRKIIADTPDRAYNLMNEGESRPTPYHQLFPSELIESEPGKLRLYLGEDYGFLRLADQSGFRPLLDPQLLVPHLGECAFPIDTDVLLKALAENWRQTPPLP